MQFKNLIWEGCLAGSVREAYDSWSQGSEFQPHVGYRVNLKHKTKQKNLIWENKLYTQTVNKHFQTHMKSSQKLAMY